MVIPCWIPSRWTNSAFITAVACDHRSERRVPRVAKLNVQVRSGELLTISPPLQAGEEAERVRHYCFWLGLKHQVEPVVPDPAACSHVRARDLFARLGCRWHFDMT
jgi:hypothetical protein